MASGIARAASGASKSGLGGILGGATGVLKGNQGGGEMGGRIEGIESRIEALETSGGGMDAAAVGSRYRILTCRVVIYQLCNYLICFHQATSPQ